MNMSTDSKSSSSGLQRKRRKVGPVLTTAAAFGTSLIGAAILKADPPPDPEITEATATPTIFNPGPQEYLAPLLYVQWDASIYTNPDSVIMAFYFGIGSTTVGDNPGDAYPCYDHSAGNWYACTAAETSQTYWSSGFNAVPPLYNSSADYEVGVIASNSDGNSSITWCGTTNE